MATFGFGTVGFFRSLRAAAPTPEAIHLHQGVIAFRVGEQQRVVHRHAHLDLRLCRQAAGQPQHLGTVGLHREVLDRAGAQLFIDLQHPPEDGMQPVGQHGERDRALHPLPVRRVCAPVQPKKLFGIGEGGPQLRALSRCRRGWLLLRRDIEVGALNLVFDFDRRGPGRKSVWTLARQLRGPHMSGRPRLDSDVDFLVEFVPGEKSYDRLRALAGLLEERLGRRVWIDVDAARSLGAGLVSSRASLRLSVLAR